MYIVFIINLMTLTFFLVFVATPEVEAANVNFDRPAASEQENINDGKYH